MTKETDCSPLTAHRSLYIWIDLANSPHVPFFRALAMEFERRGHMVEMTARAFAQTLEMAAQAGLHATTIGGHGGRDLSGKAGNLFGRALALASWARGKKDERGKRFDLAVSHNSYSQIVAARALGIKSVTLMDYEHQPANHLAFRLASRVIVPRAFPSDALRRMGAGARKVRRYDGIKEDVYLADFAPDERFASQLEALGVGASDFLVVVRPPARDALYHRFENELFDELLARLLLRGGQTKIIILARSDAQREELQTRYAHHRATMIFPRAALDGANLIAAADLVVSAGGTMNREAAALGTPAATIYAGRWAAIDEELVRSKRLQRIETRADLDALPRDKKSNAREARRAHHVRTQVADLITGEGD